MVAERKRPLQPPYHAASPGVQVNRCSFFVHFPLYFPHWLMELRAPNHEGCGGDLIPTVSRMLRNAPKLRRSITWRPARRIRSASSRMKSPNSSQ